MPDIWRIFLLLTKSILSCPHVDGATVAPGSSFQVLTYSSRLLVVLRRQIIDHLWPFIPNPRQWSPTQSSVVITTNCCSMKRRLLLGFENSQPDTAAVSLVQWSARAAVTVAGRINKQGQCQGQVQPQWKWHRRLRNGLHTVADVTTERTEVLPGGRLLETSCCSKQPLGFTPVVEPGR